MPKFRKKPVVIEAVHFTGFDESDSLTDDLRDFLQCSWGDRLDGCIYIQTLEGEMKADVGDWIIRGVKGEFYPCKPGIFEATYEPVV